MSCSQHANLTPALFLQTAFFLQDKEAAAKAKKEGAKALKEAFKPLTSWWKEQLGSKVCGLLFQLGMYASAVFFTSLMVVW
jgi:hypothetical protein